jgi:putative ABC transport system permease protein
MVVLENFRIAFRALWANKMRSILTTLGIIIGVAAVIGVVSIVQGLQHQITQQLQGVGATYVMVLPDQSRNQGPGVVVRQVKLTWEDGQAIRERISGIELITPLIAATDQVVKYRDRRHQTLRAFLLQPRSRASTTCRCRRPASGRGAPSRGSSGGQGDLCR